MAGMNLPAVCQVGRRPWQCCLSFKHNKVEQLEVVLQEPGLQRLGFFKALGLQLDAKARYSVACSL